MDPPWQLLSDCELIPLTVMAVIACRCRSSGAPYGDAVWPCCSSVGFRRSKYHSHTLGRPSAHAGSPLADAVPWGCKRGQLRLFTPQHCLRGAFAAPGSLSDAVAGRHIVPRIVCVQGITSRSSPTHQQIHPRPHRPRPHHRPTQSPWMALTVLPLQQVRRTRRQLNRSSSSSRRKLTAPQRLKHPLLCRCSTFLPALPLSGTLLWSLPALWASPPSRHARDQNGLFRGTESCPC
jgi:hypothetical protein